MTSPLQGCVALVTGASRGIGAACAVALAARGAHVVITARTEGGLTDTDDAIRAAGGAPATLLPLDLREGDQLDAIGPSLLERFGRLDVLVSAAGALGRLTPTPHIMPQDWSEVVAVNLSAAWRLIRTCGPLLQVAPAGRAVFVTDAQAAAPRAFWGAYGATKAGMEYLVRAWADETRTARLRVNLFDPGPTATRLRRAAMPGEDQKSMQGPEEVAERLVKICMPDEVRHGEVIR